MARLGRTFPIRHLYQAPIDSVQVLQGSLTLTASPTLTADAILTTPATISLIAAPTLTVSAPLLVEVASLALTATPTLSATATVTGTQQGSLSLTATPTLTVSARLTEFANLSLIASPTLSIDGVRVILPTISLSAIPTFTADASVIKLATTVPLYPSTVTGTGWMNHSLAQGSTQGNYATWTTSTSAASATLEGSAFDAQSAVGAPTEIDHIDLTVRHMETNISSIASVTAQAYVGSTPKGSPTSLTPSTTIQEDSFPVSGLTYSDLADIRVRVTVTRV